MLASGSCQPVFRNCTLSGNSSYLYGGAIYIGLTTTLTLENTIVTYNLARHEGAIYCQEPEGIVDLSCCNIYGNTTGDWVECFADQLGIKGNISADPLFCDTLGGDFTIEACSPCLPGNHPDGYDCGGPIGAWGEGCTCR